MRGVDTENWLTPAKVSKVSNAGQFGKGITKMMTVWISGNSGFLITHRQTLENFINRWYYKT